MGCFVVRVIIAASIMPPGAATASRSSSTRPGAQLRTGKLESLRERTGRFGRGALLGMSMLGSHPAFQRDDAGPSRRDPVAQMHEGNHAMARFANPGAMSPKLQGISNSLREGGTGQEADADEIDEQSAQIADESDAAESMALAARAKSRMKAATSDGEGKEMATQLEPLRNHPEFRCR